MLAAYDKYKYLQIVNIHNKNTQKTLHIEQELTIDPPLPIGLFQRCADPQTATKDPRPRLQSVVICDPLSVRKSATFQYTAVTRILMGNLHFGLCPAASEFCVALAIPGPNKATGGLRRRCLSACLIVCTLYVCLSACHCLSLSTSPVPGRLSEAGCCPAPAVCCWCPFHSFTPCAQHCRCQCSCTVIRHSPPRNRSTADLRPQADASAVRTPLACLFRQISGFNGPILHE